jgi:hypothetical protein
MSRCPGFFSQRLGSSALIEARPPVFPSSKLLAGGRAIRQAQDIRARLHSETRRVEGPVELVIIEWDGTALPP